MIIKSGKVAESVIREIFRLQPPISLDDLKGAFRRRAKELHTDTSGGDTKEQFITMKEAYDLLMGLQDVPGIFSDNGGSRKTITVDGISLHELGLGLGPNINGQNCPTCDHKGYTEERGRSFRVCDQCDASGRVKTTSPCRYCKGTGKFTQRRSGRTVDCRACDGSGRFVHTNHYQYCPRCLGTKTIYTTTEGVFYKRCWECEGSGELPMWNPVLPKGRLGL